MRRFVLPIAVIGFLALAAVYAWRGFSDDFWTPANFDVECCASNGECLTWSHAENYSCCGTEYNDYRDEGPFECCHDGSERHPRGLAVRRPNSCDEVQSP